MQRIERAIVVLCRLSVRLSVALMDCDHIGWNSSKIATRLDSLLIVCSLSADPNIMNLIQNEHPEIFLSREWCRIIGLRRTKVLISLQESRAAARKPRDAASVLFG